MSKPQAELIEDVQTQLSEDTERPSFLGCRGKKLQIVTSIMCSTGFLLFGYDQGVMGSLLTLPEFRKTYPTIDTVKHPDAHTSTMQGFVIAVYEIGCLMGALANLRFSDKYGRLKSISAGCVLMIIGGILQASAFSVGQLIVGRIVSGLGNGMNTSSIPVYQSETARPSLRGKLVMISGAVNTGGVALSYWMDFALYWTSSQASFRFPIAFQIIFPLAILPLLGKLPESPRWLARKGKSKEATRSFAALEDLPINNGQVKYELQRVRQSLEEEQRASGGHKLRVLFIQGKHRNFQRLMLGFWAQVFQQITGINLITYYAGTIFEEYIGMNALNSRILAACNGTEYFLFSFVAFFAIERLGRRVLMLIGSAGQAVTMALLTVFTWFAAKTSGDGLGIASAVLLFVFNSFFAFGWLALTWLLPAELTPLSIRAPANAVSTAGNWAFNFMVVMITPVCFHSIGSFTYTVFAVINALIVPCVYFL